MASRHLLLCAAERKVVGRRDDPLAAADHLGQLDHLRALGVRDFGALRLRHVRKQQAVARRPPQDLPLHLQLELRVAIGMVRLVLDHKQNRLHLAALGHVAKLYHALLLIELDRERSLLVRWVQHLHSLDDGLDHLLVLSLTTLDEPFDKEEAEWDGPR